MGALAVPKALSVWTTSAKLCARIGVKLDGVDLGKTVHAYDVVGGWVRLEDGKIKHGSVEPYWR